MSSNIGRHYKLEQLSIWGDYGSVLCHGAGLFEHVRADLPSPSGKIFTYQGVYPFADLMLPYSTVIVSRRLRDEIESAIPDLKYSPIYEETMVSIPWRKARANNKKPPYPYGGEPENYFTSYPLEAGFVPGVSNRLFRLNPTHKARVKIVKSPDGRVRKQIGRLPEECHLVEGFVSDMVSDLFCSERLHAVLSKHNEVVRFTPLDEEGACDVDDMSWYFKSHEENE